jgi:REP element-mobilizing transposase RayT
MRAGWFAFLVGRASSRAVAHFVNHPRLVSSLAPPKRSGGPGGASVLASRGQRENSNFQTPCPLNNFGNVNLSPANPFPQRQNPSPGVHIQFGQSNIVLLTINTEKREPWLANTRAQQLLHQTWSEATAWLVGDYLLMPDHLHLFCAPRDLHFALETWIPYWKREFALKRKRLASTLAPPTEGQRLAGTLAPPTLAPPTLAPPTLAPPTLAPPTLAPPEWKFQSRGWHHRLRDGENYSEKWMYVQENPVRKGLVKRIEDRPFKGRVFDLVWSGK